MFISGDPHDDFLRHDAEQQAKLDELPKCDCCGEPIQDDYYYEIEDQWICEECLNIHYRKAVI